MEEKGVIAERDGNIAVLTLNRPAVLNALDTQSRMDVTSALDRLAGDREVAAVVLTGEGPRAYCAGQDVRESEALGPDDGPRWMQSWNAYFTAVSSFPKPLVHAINGVAAGAGFETALMGDVRVAAPHARFIMAEIDVGLPAIVGGFLLRTQLGLSRATEMVLTGRAMGAAEARNAGIVHEIAAPGDLLGRAKARAREIAAKPPVALALNLAAFRRGFRLGLAEAEAAAAIYQSEAIASGEPQRAMASFLARKRQSSPGQSATYHGQHKEHRMGKFIKVSQDGAVAVITLNRPEVLNAWHSAMRVEITEAMTRLNADPAVKAIVITGAGERAFSAGQDLNETKTFDAARAGEWIQEWRRMYSAIRGLDKPLIAALNGVAAGSAFQVALLADVRVGHSGVRMGQPEINSGIASTLGPWLMREMIGLSRTIELTLSGRMMDADECHAIGLIHRLVPKDRVVAAALDLARELAAKPPVAMRLDKRRFREVTEEGFNDALDSGVRIQKESYASGEPQRVMEQFLAERGKRKLA
jgi:enoyl-CoA hydratase/carnithine racemase